jgi:uncharacterized protein (DUF433 family)
MSNRDLANVAIIVWGIAVLLGVFVGAPLLLGMQIDVGLIVNALAAAGAFSAAVAAVWVATSDRRVRKRVRKKERDKADKAQAGLCASSWGGSRSGVARRSSSAPTLKSS